MMKPHILDVTPRKVRMPSKHCRVFSMLITTQHGFHPSCWGWVDGRKGVITGRTCLPQSKFWSLATAAKLATPIMKRPSKRVSTSLCTIAAQLASNRVNSHCNGHKQTVKWSKEKPESGDCCCVDLSTQLVDKLAQELALCVPTTVSS